VLKEFIGNYIGTEMNARTHRTEDIAVTPANYRIKLKGTREVDGRTLEVFELHPRRKKVGLFKGEVWIDPDSGLTLHEAGQFVKSPSLFLKRVSFVRDYELRDGFAVPKTTEVEAQTRFWGVAQMRVEYSDVHWDAATAASQN
jgi:hypothetical protein